jgi:1-phosphatidylinositol-4-phosphate 5-kinase
MISFGHQSWDLAENMLLGIRDAVVNLLDSGVYDLSDKDYEVIKDFPIHREQHTLTFVDYAPVVFHNIRRLLGINADSYMVSYATV